MSLKPVHGGPDGGPEPLWDFSTNANALGPNPVILEYLKKADPSRYPDPHYRKVRQALAEAHGVAPEQVAVGTGTSELVHRLVRWLGGPVLVLSPTFSEYARAALAHKVPLWEARSPEDFLNRLPQSRLAFLCVPNNPTGEVFPFLEEAANRAGGALVLDLAYYPLMENPPPLPQKGPRPHRGAGGVPGGARGHHPLPAPCPLLARFRPRGGPPPGPSGPRGPDLACGKQVGAFSPEAAFGPGAKGAWPGGPGKPRQLPPGTGGKG